MPNFPLDKDIVEFISDVQINLKAAHALLHRGREKRKEMIQLLVQTFSRWVEDVTAPFLILTGLTDWMSELMQTDVGIRRRGVPICFIPI